MQTDSDAVDSCAGIGDKSQTKWWNGDEPMKKRLCIGLVIAAAPELLAASQPKQNSQQEQRKAKPQVIQPAATIVREPTVKPIDRPKYKPPCLEPQNHDRCDLEAQWKAADAADKGAWWTEIQAVFSAFGIIGLIFSLFYTRRAVVAADAATKEARASFEASNRPWVFVSDVKIVAQTYHRVDAHVIYKNFGNWPAVNFAKRSDAITEPYPFYARAMDEPDASLATLLPPGESEGTVIKDIDFRPDSRGYKTRILINTSYQLPSGIVVREHAAFVVEVENGKMIARKFVGYDSANHPDHAEGQAES